MFLALLFSALITGSVAPAHYLAKQYRPGLFYDVAADPDRQVRHLIGPTGQGDYWAAGRRVAGFMAQSDSPYWPGIRYQRVQIYDVKYRHWGPVITVAILDCSKRIHLEQHRTAARKIPGLGWVKNLKAEFNAELATQYNFETYAHGGIGATAVRMIGTPFK